MDQPIVTVADNPIRLYSGDGRTLATARIETDASGRPLCTVRDLVRRMRKMDLHMSVDPPPAPPRAEPKVPPAETEPLRDETPPPAPPAGSKAANKRGEGK